MSDDEDREPLSWWGTVGAVMVAGLITGGVSTLISFAIISAAARRAADAAFERQTNGGSLPGEG